MTAGLGGNFPGVARREQIIEAARVAIEEYGPDTLTGQIARRAGLARPNVYRHFGSKDDLDLAVARCAYRELREEVRRRLGVSGTPLDVIRAPVAAQVIWAGSHPNLYRFLVVRGYQRSFRQRPEDEGGFSAELAAAAARYFPHFAENPAAADTFLIGLRGLIDASILGWLARRTETHDQLIDRLATQNWLLIGHYLRGFGVSGDPVVPLPQPGQPES